MYADNNKRMSRAINFCVLLNNFSAIVLKTVKHVLYIFLFNHDDLLSFYCITHL